MLFYFIFIFLQNAPFLHLTNMLWTLNGSHEITFHDIYKLFYCHLCVVEKLNE